MRLCSFVAVAAVLVSGSLIARADTFNFNFGGVGDSFYGSGTLTGSLVSPGEYLITGITGTTYTNGSHSNLSVEGRGMFEGNDNLLLESANGTFSFDNLGLSYDLDNGAMVNVYQFDGAGNEVLERTNGKFASEAVPYSVTATTPEPSSIALLGTGLFGIAGVLKRRLA